MANEPLNDFVTMTQALGGFTESREDKFGFWSLEIFPQLLDKPHQVFLILGGMDRVSAVLLTLPDPARPLAVRRVHDEGQLHARGQ